MKKKSKQNLEEFDNAFDAGKVSIDFSEGSVTQGLSQVVKLPPIDIPSWLALEIDHLAKRQGNTRAAVIRQLLLQSIEERNKSLLSKNPSS